MVVEAPQAQRATEEHEEDDEVIGDLFHLRLFVGKHILA
jgi:hypothetical protein